MTEKHDVRVETHSTGRFLPNIWDWSSTSSIVSDMGGEKTFNYSSPSRNVIHDSILSQLEMNDGSSSLPV